MDTTFRSMTIEHMGDTATDADLDQFQRACEVAMDTLGFDEEQATAYVWGDGDYAPRVRELLHEELA